MTNSIAGKRKSGIALAFDVGGNVYENHKNALTWLTLCFSGGFHE